MVLGQTWMPRVASSAESFSVVRRVQRMPVIGSPAMSDCSACSMAAIRWEFFPWVGGRHRGASGAQLLRLAGSVGGAIQELTRNFLAGQLALLDELAQDIRKKCCFGPFWG